MMKMQCRCLYFKIYVRTLWDIYRGYAQYNQVFARKRNARFRVLHLIHNIHWLASSRKLRFIHNGSVTHRCDYMAYCQKGVLLSNICELHENKENKTYVNNGSIICDQYKPQAHQIIIIYCNVKACIGHLMFPGWPLTSLG